MKANTLLIFTFIIGVEIGVTVASEIDWIRATNHGAAHYVQDGLMSRYVWNDEQEGKK